MTIWVTMLEVRTNTYDNKQRSFIECEPYYEEALGSDGNYPIGNYVYSKSREKKIIDFAMSKLGNKYYGFIVSQDLRTDKPLYKYAPDLMQAADRYFEEI